MRVTSYIRHLLHLSIRDHCLLGRISIVDLDNISRSSVIEDRELTVLCLGDETILHTIFKNKIVSLVDPFQTYHDKILYNETEGVDAMYTCHVIDGVETISIRHTNDSRYCRMISRSNTWYSGMITVSDNLKRYDVFNHEGSIISIIHLRECSLISYNTYHSMILYDNESPDILTIEDDARDQIAICLDISKNDMKPQTYKDYIASHSLT